MAYAMVSTVRPNASATPCRQMPTFGNAAARTALPHPQEQARTSEKLRAVLFHFFSYRPRNNAVTNCRSIFRNLFLFGIDCFEFAVRILITGPGLKLKRSITQRNQALHKNLPFVGGLISRSGVRFCLILNHYKNNIARCRRAGHSYRRQIPIDGLAPPDGHLRIPA